MASSINVSGLAELPASEPPPRPPPPIPLPIEEIPQSRQPLLEFRQSSSRSNQSLIQPRQTPQHSGQTSLEESWDNEEVTRLVIGVDFGTTYTGTVPDVIPFVHDSANRTEGVGYATPASNVASLEDMEIVTYWGPQMGNSDKVPSVISYSATSQDANGVNHQQWGDSLSTDAVAMINTKLELDIGTVSEELDIVSSMLKGMKDLDFEYIKNAAGLPEFPWKSPEDIVTDYLEKVFDYLIQTVDEFSPEVRGRFPVDIVVTYPTVKLPVFLVMISTDST
jgi:hypothetical protein